MGLVREELGAKENRDLQKTAGSAQMSLGEGDARTRLQVSLERCRAAFVTELDDASASQGRPVAVCLQCPAL